MSSVVCSHEPLLIVSNNTLTRGPASSDYMKILQFDKISQFLLLVLSTSSVLSFSHSHLCQWIHGYKQPLMDLHIYMQPEFYFSCCVSYLAGYWDKDQCRPVPAPDQRLVEQSSPADAVAAEDQWPAARHWDHATDQGLILILHQHVPLLHTSHSQVRNILSERGDIRHDIRIC